MISPRCCFTAVFRRIVVVRNGVKHVQVMCVVIVQKLLLYHQYKTCRHS